MFRAHFFSPPFAVTGSIARGRLGALLFLDGRRCVESRRLADDLYRRLQILSALGGTVTLLRQICGTAARSSALGDLKF